MRSFLRFRDPKTAIALLAVALGAAVLARPAAATTVLPFDSFNLLAHSDAILVGRVETIASFLTPDSAVVTDVQVAADLVLKGSGSIYMVRQPGGVAGGILDDVEGVPRFEIGEQVLLFLERDANDPTLHLVMGLHQGKVDLVPEGSRFRLERTVDGSTTPGLPRVEDPGDSWFYLDEFLANTEVDL